MKGFRLYFTFASKAVERWVRNTIGFLIGFIAAVLSMLMEKNPSKMTSSLTPWIFSMSRVAVATMIVVTARRIYTADTIGWPEATLAMACIFAMPLLNALSKVTPEEVIAFGGKIIDRFGEGAVGAAPVQAFVPHQWKDGDPDEGVL